MVGTQVARSDFKSALKNLQDGQEAEENVGAGEECGQRVSGTTLAFAGNLRSQNFIADVQIVTPDSAGLARMLAPAETLSPIFTAGSHSGPKMTSTREPNLI